MRKVLLLLCVASFCSGCFRITYRVSQGAGDTYKNRYWNTYFVFGLVPVEESYDLDTFCRSGRVAEIRSYQSPANVLAAFLGILTQASTVEAVCLKEGLREQNLPLPEKKEEKKEEKKKLLWW